MVDYVTTPVPNNTRLAFDEVTIGGVVVLVARNKHGFGIDGDYTDVSAGNPLPVAMALGTKAASGSLSTTPSTDQDPIFDHANAVKFAVTQASQAAITPPAGCKYMRLHADGDCFIRTDGAPAADANGSIKMLANQPETIPVTAGTPVTVIAAAATVLRATPMKVR